eukprot:gnl/MRDRNA2_/MRDRNA2_80371_c0_seq1.p1 gnl/MRDRNA2_/MRDRNA2_80371_c0~~gnl/MRDRNA2_/MRDRNA2_80371_c0_seq1.p1  ORF type:complete len:791 (-),score=120.77 gnl/MRDRNA2_/MRDRNA2_80371_c0_seq1:261-2633(-)
MPRAVRQEDIECETMDMMTESGSARTLFKLPKCGGRALTFFGGAAAGAMAALLAVQLAPQALQAAAPASFRAYGDNDVELPSLSFGPSKAADVLGELTSGEIQAIAKWLQDTGIDGVKISPVRDGSPYWLGGLEAIQLLPPPKSDVLAYIDSNGPLPPRFARVRIVGPEETMEYSVGPLSNGVLTGSASAKALLSPGAVPPVKRPMDFGGDNELALPLHTDIMNELGESLLVGVFGPIFPQFKSYNASAGTITTYLRNEPLLSNSTSRISTRKMLWLPPPPIKSESQWLYPLPLSYRMDTTAKDAKQWKAFEFKLCGQKAFPSAKALSDAYAAGTIKGCPITYNITGNWSNPMRTTKPDPDGLLKEDHRGVSWGPWNFTVEQRPGTGLALFDVRFRGERILYELSLQEAHAAYAGGLNDQFYFADASFSMSQMSASLVPGVDCPKGARFLSASKWIGVDPVGSSGHPTSFEARPEFSDPSGADPTKAEDFWPICVFDFEEDHTIWRHMQNSDQTVTGLVRRTVVIRSVATVGNYDYLLDVSLREDGEIEVHTRFAGYIESRYFNKDVNPEEEKYSTIIHPGLAGPVHSHLVSWKADFDIAGARSNALKVTKVKTSSLQDKGLAGPLSTKYLEHSIVEKEGPGVSTFVANPKTPGVWSIVDRNSVSAAGNPRGYAVTLASFATLQVLPDDHPFTRSQPFTKYHLAVTKHHDDEYRVNSPYDLYDAWDPSQTQNLDRFLADEESLLDEDLVAWIGVGKEHITRQEDLPLVSNFGTAFSLQPWNFHLGNVASN